MSNASNYLENKLIDHLFKDTQMTKPSALYVALCTTAPTDASTGSTISEVSGGSYARVSVPPSSTANWYTTNGTTTGASSGTGGTSSNVSAITFPTCTVDWGTVNSFAICDASTAGNVFLWGTLSAAKTVTVNDVFSFPAGNLSISIA